MKEIQIECSASSTAFFEDVITGLKHFPKYLSSKYFYDATGDKIFQEIMVSDEYYPTRCETEIFVTQAQEICDAFMTEGVPFDIIELGAGDGSKTKFLLDCLLERKIDFQYQPIDISPNIIDFLEGDFAKKFDALNIKGFTGDYFEKLEEAISAAPERKKVVLFLGGNIGNMNMEEVKFFCLNLRGHLKKDDLLFLGIDLKKNPQTILAAYNDKAGITRRFNLNLLTRINRELEGNFNLSYFEHFPTYNPETGSCRSYLISTRDQEVKVASEVFHFQKDESIFTEISQKFSLKEITELASKSDFQISAHFSDQKNWFVNSLWKAV